MKKQLFNALLVCLMAMPSISARADVEGQSTEGKDFWVTFLQGDADDSGSTDGGALKRFKLSLSFSARDTATVTISNSYYGYDTIVKVAANELKAVAIFDGISTGSRIRNSNTDYSKTSVANGNAKYCYSYHPEMIDSCVLHVTSTSPISLFASNYKAATFDATNILPTTALQDQYMVQCYTPSDHGGDNSSQGSHFAIVATEDNTVAEYILTANTYSNHKKGDTIRTDVMKAGQVWYVWTGKGNTKGFGHGADLSGTSIKAYDATTMKAKKIAVFQGNPHTNIPFYKDLPNPPSKAIGERDHIFSQAMPLTTWGNTFVLTTSQLRDRDVIRVMAQEDGTEVYLNGDKKNPIHVFDFTKDTQQYWEFEIGVEGVSNGRVAANGDFFAGTSFLLETSCPAAVHEFMVSKKYGKNNVSNGDPAMLWINPIEQQIDQITFATYSSENGTTHHYSNVVTTADNVDFMELDGNPIGSEFKEVQKGSSYQYAQLDLGTVAGSHTLKGAPEKGFIAHVYGCTGNESYGYNAGGSAKPLTQYITINGERFRPGEENVICDDDDMIDFTCNPDYNYEKVEWHFGDGKDTTLTKAEVDKDSIVSHFYPNNGVYYGYVLIYRESSNMCIGVSAVDSVSFVVPIGNYRVDVKRQELPYCTKEGDEVDFTIYLENPDLVALSGDSVKISFNEAAKKDGFDEKAITIIGDTMLVVHLPKTAKNRTTYALHLHIGSKCKKSVVDKDLEFELQFDIPVLAQRYDNVLGVLRDSFPNQDLSDFVWFHDGDTVPNQNTSVLYLDEKDPKNSGEYNVCFTIKEEGKADYAYCSCPINFKAESKQHQFEVNPDSLIITANYEYKGDKVFVNANWNGETDIECYAQWINVKGDIYKDEKFNIPDGGCTIPVPAENGLYLLRVYTDGKSRSFKFFINH